LPESKNLDYISRNVLEHLQNLKRYGHRGQTINEIYFKFWGVIAEQSVRAQILRLEKWKLIRKITVKIKKNQKVIFYEARN
jgi:DNA-binding Lrp family transcriptional regulator